MKKYLQKIKVRAAESRLTTDMKPFTFPPANILDSTLFPISSFPPAKYPHSGQCLPLPALRPPLHSGTFALHLEVLGQQLVLPAAQAEGHHGEDERVHDADNGQDVGPAHRAVAQGVFVGPLATHALHLLRVPAVRIDHTANHHAGT